MRHRVRDKTMISVSVSSVIISSWYLLNSYLLYMNLAYKHGSSKYMNVMGLPMGIFTEFYLHIWKNLHKQNHILHSNN
jgi:hypothetical protein